jgi:hypothetical protein
MLAFIHADALWFPRQIYQKANIKTTKNAFQHLLALERVLFSLFIKLQTSYLNSPMQNLSTAYFMLLNLHDLFVEITLDASEPHEKLVDREL